MSISAHIIPHTHWFWVVLTQRRGVCVCTCMCLLWDCSPLQCRASRVGSVTLATAGPGVKSSPPKAAAKLLWILTDPGKCQTVNRERGDVRKGWLRKPSVKTKGTKTSKKVVHRTLCEHRESGEELVSNLWLLGGGRNQWPEEKMNKGSSTKSHLNWHSNLGTWAGEMVKTRKELRWGGPETWGLVPDKKEQTAC